MKDQQNINIFENELWHSAKLYYTAEKSATIRIDRWSPRQGLPTRDEPPALAGVYDPSEAFAFVVILTRMTPRSCGHTYRTTCSSRISQKVLKKELILKMLNTKKTTSINYSKIFSYSMSLNSGVKWRVPTCWTPRIKAKISPDCWRLMKDSKSKKKKCLPPERICNNHKTADALHWIYAISRTLYMWAALHIQTGYRQNDLDTFQFGHNTL